jgi:hypothetical protein
MQISEQVNSIHDEVKFFETAVQNKAMGISKNSESKPSFTSNDPAYKTQSISNIIRKIAAVFIPIIFIGTLWTWFNYNTKSIKPISNYVVPIEDDSTFTAPSNKQKLEKNGSIQILNEESYIKRIDIVQLNPDVSFGFAQKNEGSKKIYSKRIDNSPKGYNSMYRLNVDSLFLYVNSNSQSDEFLFEIQHDEESQSTLENGFYLNIDSKFYRLNNNNKLNKLILIENKSQISELNKLIKRK